MIKESCATRLKKALTMRDISQSELCVITKIPKSAMSQYVKGTFEPKQDRVWLLAKALKVSEAWLMGFDVPEKVVSPLPTISDSEQELLDNYRSLNEEGQERAKTYIEDLVDTGKYKKSSQHKLEEKDA